MPKRPRTKRRWLSIVLSTIAVAILTVALWLEFHGVNVPKLITASTRPGLAPEDRPANWAEPMDVPELPNLHRVSPDLYRGAQPSSEGMRKLEGMGVRTIVSLRTFRSDRRRLRNTSLDYERIRMQAWGAEDRELVRFLKIVTDPERTPVFVHCRHGSDRTGTACAIYRIVVQGWSKDDAIDEMLDGGYGFHDAWENLVDYIEDLDVDDLRRQAGLLPPPACSQPAR